MSEGDGDLAKGSILLYSTLLCWIDLMGYGYNASMFIDSVQALSTSSSLLLSLCFFLVALFNLSVPLCLFFYYPRTSL